MVLRTPAPRLAEDIMFKILLGYDYWFALMLEDGGAPPSFNYPPADIGRVGVSFTWRF